MWLLLVLALAAPTEAIKAQWRGAILYETAEGPGVGSINATLTISKTAITGDFTNPGGASGLITGTIGRDGEIKTTIQLFAPAVGGDAERCRGEATFKGRIYASGVLDLTADIIKLDTPSLRALNRHCYDMKRVVIRLMIPEPQH